MEIKAKVKDDKRGSGGARRTVVVFAVIFAVICVVASLLATRGIPWRMLLASPQFVPLLAAISTLATAIAALGTCVQAVYARATAQYLAAKREPESSDALQRATPPTAESSKRHARIGGFGTFVAECFAECFLSEHTAFAVGEEMRRTGADAVTASANLRVADARDRKLAAYAFLSLAYAALCVSPPAPPALKP